MKSDLELLHQRLAQLEARCERFQAQYAQQDGWSAGSLGGITSVGSFRSP